MLDNNALELPPAGESTDSNLKTVKFSASTGDFGGEVFRESQGLDIGSGSSVDRDFSFSKYGFTPSVDRIARTSMKNNNDGEAEDQPKVLPVNKNAEIAPMSSMSRPNYNDFIKRVSVVVHRHVQKCEERLKNASE